MLGLGFFSRSVLQTVEQWIRSGLFSLILPPRFFLPHLKFFFAFYFKQLETKRIFLLQLSLFFNIQNLNKSSFEPRIVLSPPVATIKINYGGLFDFIFSRITFFPSKKVDTHDPTCRLSNASSALHKYREAPFIEYTLGQRASLRPGFSGTISFSKSVRIPVAVFLPLITFMTFVLRENRKIL